MDTAAEPNLRITATIPRTLNVELEALARATGRERDALVQEALRQYVAAQEQQIEEIKAGIREADAGIFVSDEEMDALWAEYGVETARRPVNP